jgi:hypothetical protein
MKLELKKPMLKLPEVDLPTNRKFGFFFTAVFVLAGGYFLNEDSVEAAYIFLVLAVTFFLVAMIQADFLLPLNKLWMHFGLLLGKIVSPIVLGVIFFGLFTPIALVMRIVGRDELRLKVKKLPSFWKPREESTLSSIRFENQF